jgi:hypothetical protein
LLIVNFSTKGKAGKTGKAGEAGEPALLALSFSQPLHISTSKQRTAKRAKPVKPVKPVNQRFWRCLFLNLSTLQHLNISLL